MPKQIQQYRLFVATPSEISEERQFISELVTEWNVQHGQTRNVHIEVASWLTHSFPAYGDRPQAIINQQVFDSSDIVVGIFWTHFGTPTGEAGSGTEEELRRGIAQGKKMLVYFSDRPISPSQMKVTEYQKIQTFKDDFANRGIYSTYDSSEKFREHFRQHLASLMNEVMGPTPSNEAKDSGKVIPISLSSTYWTLVLAALDPMIGIIRQRFEELQRMKTKPEDLKDPERTALVGPIIARGIIVDELARHGVITSEGRDHIGYEALVKKAQELQDGGETKKN
jgi:hypothetical protein